MDIRYHKNFLKKFKKLNSKNKNKVKEAILLFGQNPFHKSLKNHALKGLMKDKRAISVTGDIRIIFEEYTSYTLVIMLDLGTHNQVY